MFSTGRPSDAQGEQEDFLLRVIRQIIRALADIAKLRRSSKPEQALVEIHEAYRALLNIDPQLVALLSRDSLVLMAGDLGLLEPIALLLNEEALILAAEGQDDRASELKKRCVALLAAAEVKNLRLTAEATAILGER